ncbi:MAG TPA: hypothetical protein VF313_05515 [Anaerolineaceae bacterium]
MKSRPDLSFAILSSLFILLLSACGPLDIKIEPIATNTQPFPSPIQVIQTPFATPAPSQPTPTTTLLPAATSTDVADLHLKPGTPVKIMLTKMLSDNNGWAIGQVDSDLVQHILFTADGGQTWKDRTPLDGVSTVPAGGLSAVAYFATDNSAWVSYTEGTPSGSLEALVVWHTADNGVTWRKSQPLDLSGVNMEFQTPSDLGFLDEQHGWIMIHLGVGMSHDYFAVFTTADGGTSWQRVLDPDTKYPLMTCYKSGLAFTSPATGWITGNCPGLMPGLFFFRSVDGGANWTALILPVPAGKPANYYAQEGEIVCGIPAINYASSSSLVVTLNCQNINNKTAQSWLYASSDGGQTWKQHLLPLPYNKTGLIGPDDGFLVGSATTDLLANGVVYHSMDGGSTWALLTSTAWTGLPDFVDDRTGWVVAEHNQETAFVHTIDGGRTWIEIKPVIGF